jgi:transcriptional regulator with XRE-family HTH domain
MAINGALERARIARAIWGYTLKDQETLATDSGVSYTRLRAILARSNPDEATLDELLALADASGVPPDFALNGFFTAATFETRVAALETAVRAAATDREILGRRLEALLATAGGQAPPRVQQPAGTAARRPAKRRRTP